RGRAEQALKRVPSPRARGEGQGEGQGQAEPAVNERAVNVVARRTAQAKPLASPAVRRRAWDLGIALQFVAGTGPGGRITRQDLDAYVAGGAATLPTAAAFARRDGIEELPVIGLRRAIAERLQQSKRHIPHFSY